MLASTLLLSNSSSGNRVVFNLFSWILSNTLSSATRSNKYILHITYIVGDRSLEAAAVQSTSWNSTYYLDGVQ